jgi:3-methyladenine DNA glycosylase AlkD
MNKSLSQKIISDLKRLSDPDKIPGMKKFGISAENALGIRVDKLRTLAKETGCNHNCALEIWDSRIHEARILASMIADPHKFTKIQMNLWVKEINSWDICDQCCNNLFRKTPFAIEHSLRWAEDDKLFIKRAGFVLMAVISVHNKLMTNQEFEKYFPLIIKHSSDERNFVKKAIHWALRQIGKRNCELHLKALETCEILSRSDSEIAFWIGRNAMKELNSEKVRRNLRYN